jgi:UDP-N-acetylmuramate dehydrogenase
MRPIRNNVPLKDRHTFHLDVNARFWAEFTSTEDLIFFYGDEKWRRLPKMILSGGSNVLFRGDFEGLVLHPAICGQEILDEDSQSVRVRVGAGEDWDRFVAEAVRRGWHGIENLSWIPGCVGTSPVQNIGAYGAEVQDVVERVEFFSTEDLQIHRLDSRQCGFGYRSSVFKLALKQTAVITHVVFRLRKQAAFVLTYPDLKKELSCQKAVTLQAVRDAVIAIRSRKLPDPRRIGNAGSFFTNPEVSEADLAHLQRRHPGMPVFRQVDGACKIPAGWLVEQCGWKGFRTKDAGVSPDHALILLNYGGATGEEILALAGQIRESVADRFGIVLTPEVTIV